jgi:hypothetical protein
MNYRSPSYRKTYRNDVPSSTLGHSGHRLFGSFSSVSSHTGSRSHPHSRISSVPIVSGKQPLSPPPIELPSLDWKPLEPSEAVASTTNDSIRASLHEYRSSQGTQAVYSRQGPARGGEADPEPIRSPSGSMAKANAAKDFMSSPNTLQ